MKREATTNNTLFQLHQQLEPTPWTPYSNNTNICFRYRLHEALKIMKGKLQLYHIRTLFQNIFISYLSSVSLLFPVDICHSSPSH